jgi:uncharacterized protein
MLTKSERLALESRLRSHQQRTGQQFAMLTVPSLQGAAVGDLGFTVANRSMLGRAGHDDGLLILVARDERQVDIQVGSGLTQTISDELAARVIGEQIQPAFREKKFALGLNRAFDELTNAANSAAPRK